MRLALPQLRRSRQSGATEGEARIDALMAIMTSLSDTCVLSRAGLTGLETMQNGARSVLINGGISRQEGRDALDVLDRNMLSLNASPGGAADLLAATLLLDRIANDATPLHSLI
ncbi:triphosphoribosyl-dephospho-CoA synthase [Cedecea neteri]|nr:triphosphoribosyl-dephospho-CoA synthase [Cedecea neteri]